MLNKIGRKDFTVYAQTLTRKESGKVLTVSESSTASIKGSLQFVTVQDKELLEIGWVKVGDGIFYTLTGTSISENDEIAEGSDTTRWVLTKQIEGENINGNRVYQAWIATRKEA